MSITLRQIWSVSLDDLQPVLLSASSVSTTNLAQDRVLAAVIYYNTGMLNPIDAEWVAHPKFNEVMSAATSYEKGLHTLQAPFVRKLALLIHVINEVAYAAGRIG